MLHGFNSSRGVLHWIWVLCVIVHIASCEGVLRRDDFSGIEFFPLMNKNRSNVHQDQAIVGKKIDLEKVGVWFKGLWVLVNHYKNELKSIRGIVDTYTGDSGNKLGGLEYEEQRIGLPLLKSVDPPFDLLGIIERQFRSSLFSCEFDLIKSQNGGVSTRKLCFKFYGYDNVDEKDFSVSDVENWDASIDFAHVNIAMDHNDKTSEASIKLTRWILAYIQAMADKIGVLTGHGNVNFMQEVYHHFIDEYLRNNKSFQGLLRGTEEATFRASCPFNIGQEDGNVFDCRSLLSFVTFKPVDACIKSAESICERIEKFSKKLGDQIREKRGKSKDTGQVLMACDDFQKQYSQDIIGILTPVKNLFGKMSNSIGTVMPMYEQEISKCFNGVREVVGMYSNYRLDMSKYIVYSVLHHASRLISDYTFNPDFDKSTFHRECSCVNVGIINMLNSIHVLFAHEKILRVFSEQNVDQYINSLREKCGTLISVADRVAKGGMTFSKSSMISDMKEILDIKVRPECS